MRIVLTEDQLVLAHGVAEKRNAENRRVRRGDGKVVEDSLGIDKLGAEAELAVSLLLDLDWDGKFFEDTAWLKWREIGHDVGPLEVRATRHQSGRLILHPSDHDMSPFVLVRAIGPAHNLAGWQWGKVGKQPQYWHDVGYGRPCFFLPNEKLRPMTSLIKGLRLTQDS